MSNRINLLFVFIFLLSLGSTAVFAQVVVDDYVAMKQYKLDHNAVLKSDISLVDSLYMYQGNVFTGIGYDRYSNNQLKSVQVFKKGYVHGPYMIWYPDGAPQLYTNYYKGAPNGRFMGWYADGRVIYNLVLNQGKLGGDYLFDSDESRQDDTADDLEKEGTDNSD
jgi:antitoxin component YwqK of YwqJK toxin-antitoxin module